MTPPANRPPARYRVRLETRAPAPRRTHLAIDLPAVGPHDAILEASLYLAMPLTIWRVVDVEQLPDDQAEGAA